MEKNERLVNLEIKIRRLVAGYLRPILRQLRTVSLVITPAEVVATLEELSNSPVTGVTPIAFVWSRVTFTQNN